MSRGGSWVKAHELLVRHKAFRIASSIVLKPFGASAVLIVRVKSRPRGVLNTKVIGYSGNASQWREPEVPSMVLVR